MWFCELEKIWEGWDLFIPPCKCYSCKETFLFGMILKINGLTYQKIPAWYLYMDSKIQYCHRQSEFLIFFALLWISNWRHCSLNCWKKLKLGYILANSIYFHMKPFKKYFWWGKSVKKLILCRHLSFTHHKLLIQNELFWPNYWTDQCNFWSEVGSNIVTTFCMKKNIYFIKLDLL